MGEAGLPGDVMAVVSNASPSSSSTAVASAASTPSATAPTAAAASLVEEAERDSQTNFALMSGVVVTVFGTIIFENFRAGRGHAVAEEFMKHLGPQVALAVGSIIGAFVASIFCGRRAKKAAQEEGLALHDRLSKRKNTKTSKVLSTSTMRWMNNFVDIIWPRVDAYMVKLMHETVAPSIAKAAPRHLRGVIAFSRVTLGDTRPEFGPLVMQQRHGANLQMKMGFHWRSKCDIDLKVGPAHVKISNLSLSATMIAVLLLEAPLSGTPLLEPPFIRGIKIFCANRPELNISFGGLASIVGFPGIVNTVHSAICGVIDGIMVLPNCIGVDLEHGSVIDQADLHCAMPLCVIRLTLQSGSDLLAGDGGIITAESSDPFVTARVGVQSWKSPTVKRSLDPVWRHGNVVDFLVYDWDQLMLFEVFDEDLMKNDALGSAEVELEKFRRTGQHAVQLTAPAGPQMCSTFSTKRIGGTKGSVNRSGGGAGSGGVGGGVGSGEVVEREEAGTLTVSVETLHLSCEAGSDVAQCRAGPSRVFLAVKVLCAENLATGWEPPFVVRVVVKEGRREEQEVRTRQSKVNHKHVHVPKELAAACGELAKRGHKPAEISKITGVSAEDLQEILAPAHAAAAIGQKEQRKRDATHPIFDQTLHLLVKSLESDIRLELQDKSGRIAGVVETSIGEILKADDMTLDGPFKFSSGNYLRSAPASLHAGFSAHLLQASLRAAEGDTTQQASAVSQPASRPSKRSDPGCFGGLLAPMPRRRSRH